MFFFTVKKVLGALLQPLPLLIIGMFIGLWLVYKKKYTSGMAVQSFCILALIAVATPFITNPLLRDLETQHVQFDLAQSVDYVVVLGCGHSNDGEIPISAQLYSCSLYRMVEGMRILRNNPGAKLITSGYGGSEPFTNAQTNKEFAVAMGIPAYRILTEGRPKDTNEEAMYLADTLKDKSFALVTSASHMQRAVKYFQAEGLAPIPAPTGHVAKDESRNPFRSAFPSSQHLAKSETLIYEYLGQAWQFLTK